MSSIGPMFSLLVVAGWPWGSAKKIAVSPKDLWPIPTLEKAHRAPPFKSNKSGVIQMADNAHQPKAEPWYPFGSGPPVAKAAHDGHVPHAPAAAQAHPAAPTAPHNAESAHKPAAEPWYPFGSGPPAAKPAHDAHASTPAPTSTAGSGQAPGARATVNFKSGVSGPASAMTPGRADSLPTFVRPEQDFASELLREKPAISIVRPVSIGASETPKSGSTDSAAGSAAKTSVVAKTDQPHAPAKPAHVHVHPPVPPRSPFGELLHAEAKEINRANGVVNSALSQGLAVDAIKAVVEARLQGHAKDIAVNLVAGATDAETISARLTQSQKIAGAIQSAASKADGPEQAKVIVSTKLRGEDSVVAAGVISGVADLQQSKSAVHDVAPSLATLAAPGPQMSIVESTVQASLQEPFAKLDQAPAQLPAAVVDMPAPAPLPESLNKADDVLSAIPAGVAEGAVQASLQESFAKFDPALQLQAVVGGAVEGAVQASLQDSFAKFDSAPAQLPQVAVEAPAPVPAAAPLHESFKKADEVLGAGEVSTQAKEVNASTLAAPEKSVVAAPAESTASAPAPAASAGVTVHAIEMPHTEVAPKSAGPSFNLEVPALESALVNLVGEQKLAEMDKAIAADVAKESRVVPVEERSSVAVAAEKSTVPVEDRSSAAPPVQKTLAPVEERSTIATPDTRASVPVEERSTPAQSATKALAPVEDRSVMAAMSGLRTDTPAAAPEKYSDMGAKDLLAAAASAFSSVPDKISAMAHHGLEKAEAAAHKAVESVSHVVQAATHTSAKVTLEEALTAHMRDKGFDAQSIAAARPIAEAIRSEPTGAQLGDAVLVLHKEGQRGDPLATVVAAKDVHAIAKPGDSVLALDTLEKVASHGMDSAAIKELRNAMPEAVKGQTDLEMSQSTGEAKSALKGLEQLQAPEQQSQRQEKVAAAEQSRDAAMSMG